MYSQDEVKKREKLELVSSICLNSFDVKCFVDYVGLTNLHQKPTLPSHREWVSVRRLTPLLQRKQEMVKHERHQARTSIRRARILDRSYGTAFALGREIGQSTESSIDSLPYIWARGLQMRAFLSFYEFGRTGGSPDSGSRGLTPQTSTVTAILKDHAVGTVFAGLNHGFRWSATVYESVFLYVSSLPFSIYDKRQILNTVEQLHDLPSYQTSKPSSGSTGSLFSQGRSSKRFF